MSQMRRVCDTAVVEMRLLEGKELYTKGQRAVGMYFIRSGVLSYHMPGYDQMALNEGAWLSEIAIWCQWIHRGSLMAKRFSELIHIASDKFVEIVPRCSKSLRKFIRAYAAHFVRHECDCPLGDVHWLTDVCCDGVVELVLNAKQLNASGFQEASLLQPPCLARLPLRQHQTRQCAFRRQCAFGRRSGRC